MKVTNLGASPVSVFCGGISMAVAPNDFIESDNFTVAEIEFVKKYPQQFGVEGDPASGTVDQDELKRITAERDDLDLGLSQFRELMGSETNFDAYLKAQRNRDTLAEIVALFGTDEVDEVNLKSAVERLIQDYNAMSAGVVGYTDDGTADATDNDAVTIDTSTGASDLASAIQLLDDANDDHWTQAGLPDISTLKTLTGGDVTRAQVDQLPEGDKRVRKV